MRKGGCEVRWVPVMVGVFAYAYVLNDVPVFQRDLAWAIATASAFAFVALSYYRK